MKAERMTRAPVWTTPKRVAHTGWITAVPPSNLWRSTTVLTLMSDHIAVIHTAHTHDDEIFVGMRN